jgi:hypothetical protein
MLADFTVSRSWPGTKRNISNMCIENRTPYIRGSQPFSSTSTTVVLLLASEHAYKVSARTCQRALTMRYQESTSLRTLAVYESINNPSELIVCCKDSEVPPELETQVNKCNLVGTRTGICGWAVSALGAHWLVPLRGVPFAWLLFYYPACLIWAFGQKL